KQMQLADFDFFLPEELIAQHPVEPRDSSRLMIVDRSKDELVHKEFRDLVDFLVRGDVLVLNNTRVMPARLFGEREGTGGKLEVLLLKQEDAYTWEVLVKPGKRARVGTNLIFGDGLLKATVLGDTEAGGRLMRFEYQGVFEEILDKLGTMPLPPYITEQLQDQERYQTVYSRETGSAAAPTAGLHFTGELLDELRSIGVEIVEVLLHVGLGTFRPVKTENILEHTMHSEYYSVTPQAASAINKAKAEGRRVISVGTTATRVLESASEDSGLIRAGDGWTSIFIYPGYRFKVVDALITNFHFPKSTLLMLVSALAGRDKILSAYNEAVKLRYRFYSFGDAMLII
ncbi:MAG TPA: tRNA preQ1(34) S-adenosylmethionine ribosyltransferase-isomerase QueA, partial [Candidatus Deferrimicrobium sp.]|nr:tRNA preQ1(34) S-adenosylmethionine ribosyltransferase-isomerase QueA [Candidatus Deferrimicrobium sp.]